MKICLIEPFHAGSHASWAEEYARCSRHDIELLTLTGRHWKWRMHGGAVTLARQFLAGGCDPDLLLVSDMLDLTTFLALTRHKTSALPTALYFHENQLTYPWSPADADPVQQRDAHYAFINYTSALAADAVLFNSRYHLQAFTGELPAFLKSFPDQNELGSLELLAAKSSVLPLALDLRRLDRYRPEPPKATTAPPLILWNHRWEYDKGPEEFFAALYRLQDEDVPFEVAILGESYRKFRRSSPKRSSGSAGGSSSSATPGISPNMPVGSGAPTSCRSPPATTSSGPASFRRSTATARPCCRAGSPTPSTCRNRCTTAFSMTASTNC